MAGGTWEFQNKKQPGIYINFKSSPTSLAVVGERGTVAIARQLNWGDTDDIIQIDSINDVYTKLGYDITNEQMRFAQQMFRGSNRNTGAARLLVYRLPASGTTSATATVGNLTATAKYAGTRGNDVSIVITPDLDTAIDPTETVGTVTLNLVDAQTPATLVSGTVTFETNTGSGWSAYTGSPFTVTNGALTISDLPAADYRFAIATVESGYDDSTALFNPAQFTIVENVGTQSVVVNATVAQTGETSVQPTDPGNVTPTPGDVVYAVYQVETIIDDIIQNTQRIGTFLSETDYVLADVSDLVDNDWVMFSGSGGLEATAGTTLVGGSDGTISAAGYSQFLTVLEPYSFTVLCYDGDDATVKAAMTTFCQRLGYENGRYSQFVTSDYHTADEIMVMSVENGYELNDGTTLTKEEATWWVAGVEASASVAQSLTYAAHPDATRAVPALSSVELDTTIDQGSMAFIEEFGLTKIMTDINTFTSFQPEKGRIFRKNRTVRVLFQIANDIYELFARYYIGVVNNDAAGRNLFKAEIISYMVQLQGQGAIQNFSADDIEVLPGLEADAIVINVAVQVTDSVEKVYMTVTVTAEETTA